MHRRHDLDTLRVIAFALLIVYHTAMAYVDQWEFHLKTQYTADWLQWPMIALNRWRMPLLFMIGGMALALAAAGHTLHALAWSRTHRLLLPLLWGMLVVVPIQPSLQATCNGSIEMGFGDFLWHYWQLQPWPADAFDGAAYGVTWNHLWFLPYLWLYSLVALGLTAVVRAGGTWRLPDLSPALIHAGWLLLPAAWLMFCRWVLFPRFPGTHALFNDWAEHAQSLMLFLLGYALVLRPRFWREVVRWRWFLLLLALAALGGELVLRAAGRGLSAGDALPAALRHWA